MDVFDADHLPKYSRDVNVIDEYRPYVFGHVEQFADDIRRHHIRCSRFIWGVLCQFEVWQGPFPPPLHPRTPYHRAEDAALQLFLFQQSEQERHIDDHVVVGLQQHAESATELAGPLEPKQRLERHVLVRVDEVSLDDVGVDQTLALQRLGRPPVGGDADDECEFDGPREASVGWPLAVGDRLAPRGADRIALLPVLRGRVHLDEHVRRLRAQFTRVLQERVSIPVHLDRLLLHVVVVDHGDRDGKQAGRRFHPFVHNLGGEWASCADRQSVHHAGGEGASPRANPLSPAAQGRIRPGGLEYGSDEGERREAPLDHHHQEEVDEDADDDSPPRHSLLPKHAAGGRHHGPATAPPHIHL